MTRLSKSREQEIRKHWAKMSKKDGFEFFGYSELLAELDAVRSDITAALRGDKDSPIVKAVSHQLGVRDLMEERDRLRAECDEWRKTSDAQERSLESFRTERDQLRSDLRDCRQLKDADNLALKTQEYRLRIAVEALKDECSCVDDEWTGKLITCDPCIAIAKLKGAEK